MTDEEKTYTVELTLSELEAVTRWTNDSVRAQRRHNQQKAEILNTYDLKASAEQHLADKQALWHKLAVVLTKAEHGEDQKNPISLLRDVAESGVSFDDERLGYVEVQIDRVTWDALGEFRV